MQCIRAPIRTICIGHAVSMAAWLLAAGARGQRMATPNAEIMIHEASTGLSGQTEDIVRGTDETLAGSLHRDARAPDWAMPPDLFVTYLGKNTADRVLRSKDRSNRTQSVPMKNPKVRSKSAPRGTEPTR